MKITAGPSTYLLFAVCLLAFFPGPARGQEPPAALAARAALIEQNRFIQIPGPNPVLEPGPKNAWDDSVIEAADAFEDLGAYYFYYHGVQGKKGYQLGVATASNPLGPFKKYDGNPILKVGPPDAWDGQSVACAMVLKDGEGQYLMWYSGRSGKKGDTWKVGLARARSPLGPWEKFKGNPIITGPGFYVGGVVKNGGKYRVYSESPISAPGYKLDYGPLALAIADRPEGPYTLSPANPLMEKGDDGDWDDGGISEAEVLYHGGMYHMFYGGTKMLGPRLESIGYAYSFDGLKFFKFGRNPVAVSQAFPNAAALSEVHAILEPPFIYLYHTLRYKSYGGKSHPWKEDLGIDVLAMQTPFSLTMPALAADTIAPGQTSRLEDARPIALGNVTRLALTVRCAYDAEARRPLRVHVVGSSDGLAFDTVDLYTLEGELGAGGTFAKTFLLDCKARFIKVTVENRDDQPLSGVSVTATLGN